MPLWVLRGGRLCADSMSSAGIVYTPHPDGARQQVAPDSFEASVIDDALQRCRLIRAGHGETHGRGLCGIRCGSPSWTWVPPITACAFAAVATVILGLAAVPHSALPPRSPSSRCSGSGPLSGIALAWGVSSRAP